jgi:hypothetical protein
MKNPIEAVRHFCVIQLELLKTREIKLRHEMQDCAIQREFLSQVLEDLGEINEFEGDIVINLLNTIRSNENE